jgi:hypothetical protein
MRKWIKEHPKITATIGAAATAAGLYYGVPPEMSGPLLEGLCKGLGFC